MTDTKQTPGSKSKPDYSELPQKPITLKKHIGGLTIPAGENGSSRDRTDASSGDVVQKKRTPIKKRNPAATQWTLRGVSKSAREVATQAAREEGVKLHEWLERAIYQAAAKASAQQEPDRAVMDALQGIRIQLDRIELESGFLYRVWQRIKVQFSKAD